MTPSRPTPSVVQHLRRICLGLPEATERPFGGHEAPAFRVRDKMFMVLREDGESLTCKVPPGEQQALVAADPDKFFIPPYVGSKGWIGIRLDGAVDWQEIAELAEDSYRLIAPKRLVARLDREEGPAAE
jgi:predicted DNA-binding protein (MmcQ/YjbR family)